MSGPAPWDYQPERFPVSDQSPPSEHDQLGWLMGEVDRVRAELEQARKAAEAEAQLANEYHAELEQARKERGDLAIALDATVRRAENAEAERDEAILWRERESDSDAQTCPHSNCDAQRWRAALELIASIGYPGVLLQDIARGALAGDQ